MSDEERKPEVVLNEAAHRFEIREGSDLAVLEYRLRQGNRLVLTHTGVPAHLEGHGYGTFLARSALEYARDHQLQVVPLCSFVQAYLQRHPEYTDLVETKKI